MTTGRGPFRRGGKVRALLAAALAACLCGCISVFPKEKPAQLYRFGDHAAATAEAQAGPAGSAAGPAFLVRARIGAFDRASAGDRILTAQGDERAYIAGARWVEPATTLVEAALRTAFEPSAPARLLAPGDLAAADARLALDVRTFEVRYPVHGTGKAPVIVVRIDAELEGAKPPFARSERLFDIETPAKADSVGAIVEAFDGAVGEALGQIVAWTNASRPAA
jgi:cholesterol transport system auxiliary component